MAEKMRVHILAKELNVKSKAIIEKCKAEGLSGIKNHMSTLSAGQEATLREWFSEGAHDTTVEQTERVNLEEVRVAPSLEEEGLVAPETVAVETETAVEVPEPEAAPVAEPVEVVAEAPVVEEPPAPEVEPATVITPEPAEEPVSVPEAAEEEPPAVETPPAEAAPPVAASVEEVSDEQEPEADADSDEEQPTPAGPQNVPKPAKLKGPRVVRYEEPEQNIYTPRSRRRHDAGPEGPADPSMPDAAGAPGGAGRRRGGTDATRPPAAPGAAGRRQQSRRTGRVNSSGELMKNWRDRDLAERRERLAGATGRRIHTRKFEMKGGGGGRPVERKTSAEVQEPIQVKDFCAAIAVPFVQVFSVLKKEHNMMCTVNSTLDKEIAELVALHFGVELSVVEAKTQFDLLKEEFSNRERTELKTRPPVITILGHVDHGKTSLLDALRKTDVVAGEDGGITQHIGAYHLQTKYGPVTFVDTPGHEAFTAMRSRGAQMTDIVVLVVAADDGVMPQTIEAISHAKAAEVPIVVALNKIDLGDHKLMEIYGQLAQHGLTPSGDWGGDIDVIRTSATTGEGLDELLEHLVALGDVMDLKADPTVDATGVTIEAETKEGVGAVARVLIQEGTLSRGDVVVCGNASGKVRAILDDRSRKVKSAGPSMPVEIWGLEDVPLAGDRLYQVSSTQRAKDIASEVAQRRQDEARSETQKAHSLEDIFKQRIEGEIQDLNVIIKADVDGSVEVLKHELSKLPSDQIRLGVRHAGVGAVNDSDVLLAQASNAIVIAFRVTTQPGAKKTAEANHVDVRYYRVIYDVVDEIIKAMEGRLAPEEKEETRATCEVRQVFKVSKVGWIAGCYVQNGTVSRNHLIRVIRGGTVIREAAPIDSIRHFKDVVKEVRSGLECGIRLENFEDIKEGDVLEAYEIVQVARTL